MDADPPNDSDAQKVLYKSTRMIPEQNSSCSTLCGIRGNQDYFKCLTMPLKDDKDKDQYICGNCAVLFADAGHIVEREEFGPLSVCANGGYYINYLKSRRSSASGSHIQEPKFPPVSFNRVDYFEVQLPEVDEESNDVFQMRVGLHSKFSNNETVVYMYDGKTGHKFDGNLIDYGPCFHGGDFIGCGRDNWKQNVFFTKNGKLLGTAFTEVEGSFNPSIIITVEKEGVLLDKTALEPRFIFNPEFFLWNPELYESEIGVVDSFPVSTKFNEASGTLKFDQIDVPVYLHITTASADPGVNHKGVEGLLHWPTLELVTKFRGSCTGTILSFVEYEKVSGPDGWTLPRYFEGTVEAVSESLLQFDGTWFKAADNIPVPVSPELERQNSLEADESTSTGEGKAPLDLGQLQSLIEMGFSRKAAKRALRSTSAMEAAVEWLFSNSVSDGEDSEDEASRKKEEEEKKRKETKEKLDQISKAKKNKSLVSLGNSCRGNFTMLCNPMGVLATDSCLESPLLTIPFKDVLNWEGSGALEMWICLTQLPNNVVYLMHKPQLGFVGEQAKYGGIFSHFFLRIDPVCGIECGTRRLVEKDQINEESKSDEKVFFLLPFFPFLFFSCSVLFVDLFSNHYFSINLYSFFLPPFF